MEYTEVYKALIEMRTEEIRHFVLNVIWTMDHKRIVDAMLAVAEKDEINNALRRMGRSERIE